MDPERFQRIMGLFQEANRLSDAEVAALLDNRCGEDAELRAEVVALLEHATGCEGPINTGAGMMRLAQEVCPDEEVAQGFGRGLRSHLPRGDDGIPMLSGQYRILRVLGEGGMGTVYEAEQLSPRRLVALKAIRRGFASRQMLRRFQQEAHILGCLQHPGIAQIFDAGAADGTGTDEAYFVMELVRGKPLTEHAASLDVRGRLELMADVCDAVHHAHQRGIIHRDLKPGNILVDPAGGRGRGQPKVLDFGVARTSHNELDGATIHTAAGQLIGTLSYMSPEQIAADPDQIDVRSDVYSLGVILYQVLAGHLPLNLRDKPIHEAARIVCEEVPARLGTIHRAFRGEIETIVARSIEKDKSRRYQSAADLGDDLRRYLAGDAIEARKDSTLYVIRKQMVRHKAAVVVALVTILGICLIALFAVAEAKRNKALANTERAANEESTRALRDVRVARERADREAAALRESLYATRISVAQAAFLGGDAEHMRRALEACAPEQRGWEWHYLQAQADQSVRAIQCFAPGTSHMMLHTGFDGTPEKPSEGKSTQCVYASQLDGFVAILDAATGDVLSKYKVGDNENIVAHEAGPTRSTIATGGTEGTITVRSALTGAVLASWKAHATGLRALQYSRDGQAVLTAATDGSVRLWDASTLTIRLELEAQQEYTLCAVLSPDADAIITGGTSGVIRVWNARTGALMRQMEGHDGSVLALAFSADGRFLVSGGDDRSMRVWEAATGRPVSISRSHTNKVIAVALNADGSLAASGGSDSTVRITDTATGREMRRMLGHAATVTGIAFTNDGTEVITSSRDGTIRWWRGLRDPATPTWTTGIHMVHDVVFSPDGTTIAVAGESASILIYDAASHSVVREIVTNQKPTSIYSLAYSLDGSMLFAGGRGGSIVAWDPRTGLEVQRRVSHVGDVYAVAVSPVTGRLASVSTDHVVYLWPADPSEPPTRLEGHSGAVTSLVWFADGSRFASGSYDGTIRIWNAANGTCERILKIGDGREAEVHSLALADADRVLVCGTECGQAQVWETAQWRHVGTLHGHKGSILSMNTSPDGTRVVTGGFDTTVRVFDIRACSELIMLPAHSYQVLAVGFSRDGSQLVSTGDGKVKFWVAGERK